MSTPNQKPLERGRKRPVSAPVTPAGYSAGEAPKRNLARKVRKFFLQAGVDLHNDFTLEVVFHPGTVAEWGVVYAKFYQGGLPIVEACNTPVGIAVRQWDGSRSGESCFVTDLRALVDEVRRLAALKELE
jgi:hypothetical protein